VIRYALRLSLFTLVALIVVAGTIWMFRGQVLRFAGISFDSGAAGETAVQSPEGLASGVFASGLLAPRFMAVSRDGVLFVAERGADRVEARVNG